MTTYQHHVTGFFVKAEEAYIARSKLMERGLPAERVMVYTNELTAPAQPPRTSSNAALKDLIVDGAIGTAVGTGVGVLGELALVAANVTLFVASPLIAPLAMLGWGASLGGVVGAVMGAGNSKKKEGKFADLVQDAILNGQVVLVVQTLTEVETTLAKAIIEDAVGEVRDVSTV